MWDKLKPAGSQKLRLADDDIRANNAALEAALDLDHDFTTGDTQTGEHHKVTLPKQESDPSEEVDKGKLYTKEVDDEIELFYRDKTAAHILQLTRGGEIALIPAGTKMLFYQDTAPTGWTIQDTLDEKLVFITKGKGIGGEGGGGSPGGEPHLGSFAFDGGSNAEDLLENDTIRYTGGGSWSCRLRSIEYSGSAPNQIGRIYYDTLAGGTPGDDDPIEDNNARGFTAAVNGLNRAAGSWTISGMTHAHTHPVGQIPLEESGLAYHISGVPEFRACRRPGENELYVASVGVEANSFTALNIRLASGQNTGGASGAPTHDGEWRPKGYASIIAQKD